MSVTTPEEFFAVLQRSKLLTPAQMAQAREAAEEGDDPKTIAKRLARRELITRWQAGQLLAGRSSFYLGKYRLIELLGRGGMGNVFLGRHVTMNRLVALKIISRQVGKDPASLELFLAEARAIAALDHPNIVQAYSVDYDGGRYYMVMEYVEGLDLQRMVDEEGPLDCRLAVEYIRQAADGLEHAHQRNMIHCDVKPSNLLVNMQGVVKILDLGLARLTQGERPKISDSQERVLGSVDYLAPEQALESGELDHRADIYSLGCTLYFLLVGHPPFPKGTLAERILKHQTEPPPRLRGDVPAELADICAKMMAKRPSDRYSSAAQANRALILWKSSASSSIRAAPLPRAKPIEDAADSDFLGLGLDDEIRERLSAGRRKKNWLVWIFEVLFATPLRCSIAIVLSSVALLGALYLMNVDHRRLDQRAVEQAAQSGRATFEPTSRSLDGTGAEKPDERAAPPGDPPSTVELPSDAERHNTPSTAPRGPAPRPAAPKRPQEPPSPPTEAPPLETLIELADAVDLPPPPSKDGERASVDRAVVLGKMCAAPEEMPFIELVGGAEVFPSGQSFHVDRDFSADDDFAWIVGWQSEARGDQPAKRANVACVWLDGDLLRMFWLPGAADAPAGYLDKCGLVVSAGATEGFVALSRPTTVEPIGFNPDKPIEKPFFRRDDLPAANVLRLEILGFSPLFPAAKMASGDIASARKAIEAVFEGSKLPPMALRVQLDPRLNGAQIEHSLTFQVPGERRYRPLRTREVIQYEAIALATKQHDENKLKGYSRSAAAQKILEDNLRKSTAWATRLTALKNFCAALEDQGRMYFRVYAQYGERRIDLLVAPPPVETQGVSASGNPSIKGR
ncbi:MAG: protein kinase [Pirellulales bacterium]|nr:protein kinase [Pirellulales bacterium]